MGKGKGGESTQEIKLDPKIEKQALANMELANIVSRLPPMQNFGGTVAAFTPQQEAAMAATNSAAGSMGLPTVAYGGPNGGMGIPGLPQAQNFGGFQGYSTQSVFEDAMARVPQATKDLYNQFFFNPQTGAAPTYGYSSTQPKVARAQRTPYSQLSDRDKFYRQFPWMEND